MSWRRWPRPPPSQPQRRVAPLPAVRDIFISADADADGRGNCVINAHLWVLYLPNSEPPQSLPVARRAHPRGPLRRRLIQVQEHFALVHIRPKRALAPPSPLFYVLLLPMIFLLYSELAIVLNRPLPPKSSSLSSSSCSPSQMSAIKPNVAVEQPL